MDTMCKENSTSTSYFNFLCKIDDQSEDVFLSFENSSDKRYANYFLKFIIMICNVGILVVPHYLHFYEG